MKNIKVHYLIATVFFLLSHMTIAQEETEDEDLYALSLEDLMNMTVTSVSKKAERLQDVASSIYVLTNEDIVNSGGTTLHEVLRTVPGYWGTQTQYNNVTPTMRNSPTENGTVGTVLYLLDGTPIQELMSSIFSFSNFDIPLDDIDRIEIIRGSGGTIYGANSATGVVNIFTKNPGDYEGVQVRADLASPNFVATSLSAGGQLSDNFSLSGYAKLRLFNGFESLKGKDEDGNTTVAASRFTDDYEKDNMYSFGVKADFDVSDKAKLSFRTHYNTTKRNIYTNHYPSNFIFIGQDVLTTNKDVSMNRLVGNFRFDYNFSDDHSLFFRASTNKENDFIRLGAGGKSSNSIYDFEIQDNIALGDFNDLSVGINYRLVNFDIHDINIPETINYVDPQANESLTGAFIQNKFKLADGKFNIIAGIKAENYSLVNDDYYLSPMLKATFIPTDNVTIWGGYTLSYTTPGFNNTNIDLFIFEAPTIPEWVAVLEPVVRPQVTAGVYQGVYDPVYAGAIQGGADPAMADAAATAAAEGFIASPAGMATIDGQTNGAVAGQLQAVSSFAVKNGSQTLPTKFQTLEFGIRASLSSTVSIESNLFYSIITDGISVSPVDLTAAPVISPSITDPSRSAQYVLYGNYVKGTSVGAESMIKVQPTSGLLLELSHAWTQTDWEFQENDDFDISDPNVVPEKDQTPEVPIQPEHVIRLTGQYDVTEGLHLSLGVIYASKFSTQSAYIYGQERYVNVINDPNGDNAVIAAEDTDRTIVNLRIEKSLMDDKLSVYAFGNDILNDGKIAQTNRIAYSTLSQIARMYGIGASFRF